MNKAWWRCDNPNLDLTWELPPLTLNEPQFRNDSYKFTRSLNSGLKLKIFHPNGEVLYLRRWNTLEEHFDEYIRYTIGHGVLGNLQSIEMLVDAPPPAVTGTWVKV